MVNFSGIAAVGAALVRPGLVVPHIVVPDIRSLSWTRAKRMGISYVIFDKDNCITAPHSDALAPTIEESFKECLEVFGSGNVLIVSNSAGSSSDLGAVGAQHLSRRLYGTPVLCHPKKKPAKGCARQVVDYLGSLQPEASSSSSTEASQPLVKRLFSSRGSGGSEGQVVSRLAKAQMGSILVVGDRITTDTVLSHRVSDILTRRFKDAGPSSPRAISVLTSRLWATEGVMNTLMRKLEETARTSLVKRGIRPGAGWKRRAESVVEEPDWTAILDRPIQSTSIPPLERLLKELPSRGPSDPTPALYLATQLQRSRLPPILSGLLVTLLTNRFTTSVTGLMKDGWLLILQGIREGLDRPSLVFDDAKRRLPDRRSSSSSSVNPTRPSVRSYSTLSRRPIKAINDSPLYITYRKASSSMPSLPAGTEKKDEAITSWRVRLVDPETKKLLEPQRPRKIMDTLDRTRFFLLQVTQDDEPIVKIIDKKEAFLKAKEIASNAKKSNNTGASGIMEIQLTWLVTEHDLSHKITGAKKHFQKKGPGSKVTIAVSTRKGKKWTSGTAEEKEGVMRKIEEMIMAESAEPEVGGEDQAQAAAGEDGEESPAPAAAASGGGGKKQKTIKVRRKGEVTWANTTKTNATVTYEAYMG